MYKNSCIKTWEHVWSSRKLEEQLSNLTEDEYFVEISEVIKRIQKKSLILEAGCGLGRWVIHLSCVGFRVIGIDVVKSTLQVCQLYGKNRMIPLNLVCSDALKLPFRRQSFDLILSLGVIEHLEGEETAIREAFTVLRNGGYLFVSVPNSYHLPYSLWRWHKKKLGMWRYGSERSYSAKSLARLLRKVGFSVIHQKTFGFRVSADYICSFLLVIQILPYKKRIRKILIRIISRLLYMTKIFGFYTCVIASKGREELLI